MLPCFAEPVEKILIELVLANSIRNSGEEHRQSRKRFDESGINDCIEQMRTIGDNLRKARCRAENSREQCQNGLVLAQN